MKERAIELRSIHLCYVFAVWDNWQGTTLAYNAAIFRNPHYAFKFAAEYPIHHSAITIVIDYGK